MPNNLNDTNDAPAGASRRDFLAKAMAVGGSGFLLTSMKAWGMDTASTRTAPPAL